MDEPNNFCKISDKIFKKNKHLLLIHLCILQN